MSLFKNLPDGKYQIVLGDPPWNYKGQTQHAGEGRPDSGSSQRHYDTLTLAQLKSFPIDQIADPDCLLFLWTTNPHLDQSIELGKAWGFSYATVAFVWDKQRVNPGFYTLSQCEQCLVFKRGRIPSRVNGARNERQFLSEMRGKHSEKPEEVRRRIERMFPDNKRIELFARKEAKGWDTWGEELQKKAIQQ